MSPLYERLSPRLRPTRELRSRGRSDGWGARISWLGTAGFIIESRKTARLADPFVARPGLRRITRPSIPDDLAVARHVLGAARLHLLPGIDLEGVISEVFTRVPDASVITPDYEEPICVPLGDARGSVLATS